MFQIGRLRWNVLTEMLAKKFLRSLNKSPLAKTASGKALGKKPTEILVSKTAEKGPRRYL